MAFETGTASSLADLQTKIEAFLTVSAGYTLTAGILTKTGTLIHVKFDNSENPLWLSLEMGKSSSAGSLLYKHPALNTNYNDPQKVGMANGIITGHGAISFPINYEFQHLTANGEMFRCVIEYNDGYTQNIGFGEVVKAVNYYGGVYIDGSTTYYGGGDKPRSMVGWTPAGLFFTWEYFEHNEGYGRDGSMSWLPFGIPKFSDGFASSTQLWAEVSGLDWYTTARTAQITGSKYENLPGLQTPLLTNKFSNLEAGASLQTHNANNTLVPIRLFGHTADGNYQRLGDVPDIRWTNIKNLNFGQILDDGTDKWKVYPAYRKNAASLNGDGNHSGQIGYAVRYDGP